ncbi:hypothetical protein DPSP01_005297 [Paraphaeosphaeria sporulosa]|uniref:Uncharacterized protein n=1 Tax=Paraphaeosphaeria sporulosa TaxID=1460663 RepID=A0A177C678_9PLEO|nr:uncharacterized protein CC84DRAFT_1220710 [Paraphaeosphaeria sporulosa]OAG02382.1 hypothetical protein CC84DRAFT_1220710 [Paraphaeosphaeria sporulosa]
MRSSTTFLAAAAALLTFAAATPLERRYNECRAPQQWHVCGDGWAGCCSVSPCKGPAIASGCPDEGGSNPPTSTVESTEPSSAACSSAGPTPGNNDVDNRWFDGPSKVCKEDDSDCNWKPMFHTIKNYDEEFAKNSSSQFYAWQDGAIDNSVKRRDVIAVYKDIPDSVKNCSIHWYKPMTGIFYGTYGDGSFNISLIDTGDKGLEEAVGGKINWKNTEKFFEKQTRTGALDLGNWGWSIGDTSLSNSAKLDCSGKKELVVHFALSAGAEGAVIVDQISEKGKVNGFVQRAGWVLKYE